MRRAALFAALFTLALAWAMPASAQEFPPSLIVAGRPLQLNGVGARIYSPLGVTVYRAALYLEQRQADAATILRSPEIKVVVAHYLHDVGETAVLAAWQDLFRHNCGCPLPDAFRNRIRPIRADDWESYTFLPDRVLIAVNGGAPTTLIGEAASRALFSTWIGAYPPTAALKRGLLGAP